ncbi:MAG: ATP-binding cassette domain-containing protein [Acidimicrobiia bacterium]|nr:ATP-binding cassette domain-containing protein [Acidimicrobiia bacterium]
MATPIIATEGSTLTDQQLGAVGGMSGRKRFARRFLRNKVAMAGASFVLLLVIVAIFAPLIAPYDPNLAAGGLSSAFLPPSGDHWLGTDGTGLDQFSRVVYGTRLALLAGIEAVAVSLVIGLPIGLFIGYFGGWTDRFTMRVVEAIVAVPTTMMAMAIIAATGPGIQKAMFAVGFVYAMAIIRLARAEVLGARAELYVDGARAAGASDNRIMWRHILPNVAPALIVQSTLLLAASVLIEAGLSLLGLGAGADQVSWGIMLRSASQVIDRDAFQAWPAGIALFLTVLALNAVGDGLRDAFAREARGGRLGVGQVARVAVVKEAGSAPPPEPGALVVVRDLTVTFPRPSGGEVAVVQNVSLDIEAGEVLALVGESGSGKSITALAMLGLVPDPGRVTASSITLGGRDLVGLPFKEMRKIRGKDIGVIFQEPSASLNPAYTIGDQVSEPLRTHLGMSKKQARARAAELLDLVGIPQAGKRLGDYPHQYSGGMAQRVMIAIALACEPKLLIADEPTTALDVTVQGQVLDLLLDLRREFGMSILLITHDLGVVADVADRGAVMYAGQIIETGPLADVFRAPRHPYTEGLLVAVPRNERRVGTLPTIPGVVPPPWEWPVGCHFAPRCRYAADECRAGPVPLVLDGSGRGHRCARADELTLRGVADREAAVAELAVPVEEVAG